MPSLAQALDLARARGLDSLDAQLLMLLALGTAPEAIHARRTWLIAHGDDPLPAAVIPQWEAYLARRAAGEPLAYLTGHKEFFGMDLRVDRRVLIPRPDTETLVSWALEVLGAAKPAEPLAVLDLGTGSGAIALALKRHLPSAHVDAVDASADALAVARANAETLVLQIGFTQGSWLENVARRYHCIVANPPYVAAGDPHLQALAHEPHSALVSGADGLEDIRRIVRGAAACLRPGGWLLLEHGYDQAPAVRELLSAAGYRTIASRRDLAGHERCTGARAGN